MIIDGWELASASLNLFVSLCAISINVLMLYLVLTATPSAMKTYSMMMVNFSITYLFSSTSYFLTLPRIWAASDKLLFFFYGLCGPIGGGHFCFGLYSVLKMSYMQTMYCVLISVIFRYKMLKDGSINLKIYAGFIVLLWVFIIGSCGGFYWVRLEDYLVDQTMLEIGIFDKFNNIYRSGIDDVFGHYMILCAYYFFPCVVCSGIAAVLIMKSRKIIDDQASILSAKTIRLQKDLLKALTLQSLLPLELLLMFIIYFVNQVIYQNPLLEILVMLSVGLDPLLSAAVTVFSISPYRNKILRLFRIKGSNSQVSDGPSSKAPFSMTQMHM